ncbi:hypothetical protein ANN_08805 [Periplaneta americana]|uniref:Uncharacterized protein n=1 Tax=Periplaneta americana TaxID=6978 RepID=A0ABQ8T3Y5_PERAM|nr:hypothetical protein ANN_08805 [Periplaneta americana]
MAGLCEGGNEPSSSLKAICKNYFTHDTTVVNFISKNNKNFVIMSTLHLDNEASNRNDKKPQMILDYNASKLAVDIFDQVTCTAVKKKKWPHS